MYIDPRHLRGIVRFDLRRFRPQPKDPAERFPAALRKQR